MAAGAVHAQAEDACTSEAQIESAQRLFAFESLPGATDYVHCDDSNLKYKAWSGLSLLSTFDDLANEKDGFDQGILGRRPLDFLQERVKRVIFDSPAEQFCNESSAWAYVNGEDHEAGILHLCPAIVDTTPLYIAAIFLHEARHMNGFVHEICERGGFLRGTSGCDKSFEQQGAHAVDVEFLIKVSRTKKLAPSIRKEARSRAIRNLIARFNELPLDLTSGAALASDRGEVVFYDGATPTKMGGKVPEGFKMSSRRDLTFVDGARSRSLKYGFKAKFDDDDFVSEPDFLAALTEDERRMYRDTFEADDFTAVLLNDTLIVWANGETKRFSLPTTKARSFLISEASSLIKSEVLHVVDESSRVFALPKTWSEISTASELRVLGDSLPLLSIANWGVQEEIAVRLTGEVVIYDVGAKKWAPAPKLEQFKAERMVAPYIWSKKLEKL